MERDLADVDSRAVLGRRLEDNERAVMEIFQQIKERFPLLRPKLYLPYRELQALAVL